MKEVRGVRRGKQKKRRTISQSIKVPPDALAYRMIGACRVVWTVAGRRNGWQWEDRAEDAYGVGSERVN